jgi:hypothetical protein
MKLVMEDGDIFPMYVPRSYPTEEQIVTTREKYNALTNKQYLANLARAKS